MSKKLTIEEMQSLADNEGGKCLSKTYVNSKTKLKWECVEGHLWEAMPNDIKQGHWCPVCASKRKGSTQRLSIEHMKQLAAHHNGKCLSNEYINSKTNLRWECAKGHQWESAPGNIRQGNWCPVCAGNIRCTIEEVQKIAESKGGKCLSNEYINDNTKLKWECAQGHQWNAVPNSIKQGRWCPHCGIENRSKARRLTIEEMQDLAEKRGGKCLSKSYFNSVTKIKWECSEGHQWDARPADVKQGYWCPYCSGTARLTIEDMFKLAEERGGKCFSSKYTNNRTKLLWECFHGHQWEAAPDKVKQGRWCPECSTGLGERICRAFFEQLYDNKFPKSYPQWLINDRGNQMELDGYCKKLHLAFEHQGEQHYSLVKPFINTEAGLIQRKRDDQLKVNLCKNRGILLIQVPEILSRLSIDEIKPFIKRQCLNNQFSVPIDFNVNKVELKQAYQSTLAVEMMNALNNISEEKGGKCLSEYYVNDNTKLKWKCADGHQWEAIPNTIKNGSWCPICIGRYQTIEDMHELAAKKVGKCLSDQYMGSKSKLLWECAEGHQWEAIPNTIKSGKWCPICGIERSSQKRSFTIADMHKLAEDKGGKCLSEKYIGSNSKLKWECVKGHQWEASPSAIKSRTWCPICSGNTKLTIEEMQILAVQKGGRCLSKKYINSQTKLLWECSEGHQWEAAPSNIKAGYWCHYCSRTVKLTIEEMQILAKERNGKCVSNEYINSKTKLTWECSEGHQWEAIPNNIRKGSWCPVCAGKKQNN
jgi:hypothetical protein